MARNVTLLQMRTKVRMLCDIENDTHISDPEIDEYLNNGIAELWDMLVENGPQDYYAKRVTWTTTPNQISYPLTTIIPAGDFYKIRNLYVSDGDSTGPWRSLDPQQEASIISTEAPRQACLMRLDYIQASPKLVADADVFDGINGWEEYPIALACADVKTKREEDVAPYLRKRDQMAVRIRNMATRDAGTPERVNRRKRRPIDVYFFHEAQANSYRLIAGNLEIYQSRFPLDA